MLITPSDNPQPQKIIDIEVVVLGWTVFALWVHYYSSWQQAGVILFGYGVEWVREPGA